MPIFLRASRRLRRVAPQFRLATAIVLACASAAVSPQALAQSRGELLYETACRTCHDEQVHWRANRLATDWASLEAQVRRWQAVGRLQWSDDDIRDVARFLNERVYHFDPASPALTSRPVPAQLSRR